VEEVEVEEEEGRDKRERKRFLSFFEIAPADRWFFFFFSLSPSLFSSPVPARDVRSLRSEV